MTDFTMVKDADGVATITWDVKAKSMNVMSTEAFGLLSDLVDQALADGSVKGIIITSGKKDFAGGMDLNAIAKMRQDGGAKGIFDGVMMASSFWPSMMPELSFGIEVPTLTGSGSWPKRIRPRIMFAAR